MNTLNKYIDHTLLKPEALEFQIETLCKEALQYDFMSVCVNPYYVSKCAELLKGSDVKVCTVIGFPLGQNTTETKVFETKNAIANGATEIDMVINVGALKDGKLDVITHEIKSIKEACGDLVLKVILETCLLSDEEIVNACNASVKAGADFVKTSTGFNSGGATVEAVTLMKQTVGDKAQVKASGGVRSFEDAQNMINAGATRLGTSGGVALMQGQKVEGTY
ncbi:2-deoxyribose-5-phosphate aldolase [Erysipelothrix larvae]|uniref:Deoxyribose-phosphate aldolase n=1 Tax=Erysipelothrix larvae TaxID=1514105 RepID=A0A0X8GZN8_9FIRM|nr:deoxyribose-phosphate aldolase [Erysipelothrix larvae]AMC93387.1 2-deoxyribose-5-phosphate aldolase [Erysipelothrix larvae]